MPPFTLEPIAWVRSDRARPIDDHWKDTPAIIELDPAFEPEAIAGIAAFSHLEVVFVFDRVPATRIVRGARHPRNRADWPRVGIFAQRGKSRPNRLGVSRCRLVGVDGRRLRVLDLDAIDGTPVVDIKPWMTEFGPIGATRQPEWATALMADYYASGDAGGGPPGPTRRRG